MPPAEKFAVLSGKVMNQLENHILPIADNEES